MCLFRRLNNSFIRLWMYCVYKVNDCSFVLNRFWNYPIYIFFILYNGNRIKRDISVYIFSMLSALCVSCLNYYNVSFEFSFRIFLNISHVRVTVDIVFERLTFCDENLIF